jgi:NADPH2:quinone reductase
VIPHSDGAGTIDKPSAPALTAARIGERVWTLERAVQARLRHRRGIRACCPSAFKRVHLPDNTDFAVGACLGIPAMTAYHAIMLDGSVRGKTLLVQGGAGAVGFYAIQFAKLDGATVIATVSSEARRRSARASAGADHIINYRTDDRVARIADITGGKGVDRIIEVDLQGERDDLSRSARRAR